MSWDKQAEKPFWRYADLLVFFGLAVPCILVGTLLMKGVAVLFHLNLDKGFIAIPGQFLGFALLFWALSWLLKMEYGEPFWRSLGWVSSALPLATTILCGVLLTFAVAAGGVLLRTPDVDTPLREMLAKRSTAILIAVAGTTVGPLCEELGFRGFLQPLLVGTFGPLRGIILAAVPFGLLHAAQNAFSWRHVLLITLAGMAFGAMRHFSGSTRASTWMHAAYNSTMFLAFFAPERKLPGW